MVEYLLTSEAFVKGLTSISGNLNGQYVGSSIREAQEIGLRSILGDTLLDKLKDLLKNGTLDAAGNEAYKDLVDKCQYYLAYSAIVEICVKTSYKVANFGVTKTQDENLQVATHDEMSKMQFYYQAKADACCYSLQNFLLNNCSSYPELTEGCCARIKANLKSAASCGIFLGGARGRIIKNDCR